MGHGWRRSRLSKIAAGVSTGALGLAVAVAQASDAVGDAGVAALGTVTTTPSAEQPAQQRRRIRDECAPELGLVVEKETVAAYVRNARVFCNASSHWAEQHVGQLPHVLGIVAPWHDHSYRAARYFRRKLTGLSPLWYRALPDRNGSYELAGQEFANQQRRWSEQMSAPVCQAGRCFPGPAMLPTISLEGFDSIGALRSVLESPAKFAVEVALVCDRHDHAGVILDIRLALFRSLKPLLPPFVAAVSQALRTDGRRLLLSVPGAPAQGAKGPDFDRQDAVAVADAVDGVIIGARDFSRSEPGPSAPLHWVRACVTRLLAAKDSAGLRPEQVLLEVPMYGRAFQEGAEEGKLILAKETIKVLANLKPKVEWDADCAEHFANVSKKSVYIAMPTLKFVEARLLLARSLGVGVALRELGAEFDAALDLLPYRRLPVDSEDGTNGAGVRAEGRTVGGGEL